jgi:hypothetical protein
MNSVLTDPTCFRLSSVAFQQAFSSTMFCRLEHTARVYGTEQRCDARARGSIDAVGPVAFVSSFPSRA